jgi:hypothetical protein
LGGDVNFARHRLLANAFSTGALGARILDRHRDSFRVEKGHLAVANLGRVITATLKLSSKHGFHATTLRQLAKAPGLSMGGLYTYIDRFATDEVVLTAPLIQAAAAGLVRQTRQVPQTRNIDRQVHRGGQVVYRRGSVEKDARRGPAGERHPAKTEADGALRGSRRGTRT